MRVWGQRAFLLLNELERNAGDGQWFLSLKLGVALGLTGLGYFLVQK